MKILIAGLGSAGMRHLKNMRALGYDDFVLYRTFQGSMDEETLDGIPTFTDIDEALRTTPLAAIIANPSSLHINTAMPIAEAGCHLFIEKPVSHSPDGIERLSGIIDRKKLVVQTGYQYRFHPALQRIKQLIDEKTLGDLISAHAHWGEYLPDWHNWEDYRHGYSARADLGGGVILTLSHPVDYLRWIMGEVKSVMAISGQLSQLAMDVEDSADMTLKFESGATATLHLDYIQRPRSHWLYLACSNGAVKWDEREGAKYLLAGKDEWEAVNIPDRYNRNTMFEDEIKHFLECVTTMKKPLADFSDGVKALKICSAVKLSAAQGRSVIVKGG